MELYIFTLIKTTMKKLSIMLAAVLLLTTAAFAQEKSSAAVKIYHPEANARAAIDSAVVRAAKQQKHVFIQVGGNWCPWCLAFHQLVDQTPELKAYLNEKYETVLVNWSKENKNEAVMASLGYPGRFGYPVFVILDGQGNRLHTQNSAYLEEGKGHSAKKVMDFLKNWTYAAVHPASAGN